MHITKGNWFGSVSKKSIGHNVIITLFPLNMHNA